MHNLPLPTLSTQLRAAARGVYAAEAATELLIAHGRWLHRPDFLEACVEVEQDDDGTLFAWLDWDAVARFLDHAVFSSSEGRILRLAAELAGRDSGVPLDELLIGLDHANARLVVEAVAHALGLSVTGPVAPPLRPAPGTDPRAGS